MRRINNFTNLQRISLGIHPEYFTYVLDEAIRFKFVEHLQIYCQQFIRNESFDELNTEEMFPIKLKSVKKITFFFNFPHLNDDIRSLIKRMEESSSSRPYDVEFRMCDL